MDSPQLKQTYQYGVASEALVAQRYEDIGFKQVSHRFKTPYGEIDLIMQQGNLIVFVEVKARNSLPKMDEIILPKQIKRSIDAANYFIATGAVSDTSEYRFDLAVVYGGAIYKVLENAWFDD